MAEESDDEDSGLQLFTEPKPPTLRDEQSPSVQVKALQGSPVADGDRQVDDSIDWSEVRESSIDVDP